MKEVKGLTLKEIVSELGIPENTVKVRLFRAGIEPLFRGALYPLDTIDKIRDAPMGRPKKPPEPESKPAPEAKPKKPPKK
jgi:hypothetical protein